jgi:mono/diheme cytochrome c family protein
LVLTGASTALRAALVVAALAALTARADTAATIRDGVYTLEQAARGRIAYTGPCDRCHGYKLDGASEDPDMLPAPPVAGPKLLRKWSGRPLAALFEYVRTTMPANNPGYLSDAEVAEILAYMLAASGMPAGANPLPADRTALAAILIVQQAE